MNEIDTVGGTRTSDPSGNCDDADRAGSLCEAYGRTIPTDNGRWQTESVHGAPAPCTDFLVLLIRTISRVIRPDPCTIGARIALCRHRLEPASGAGVEVTPGRG